MTETLIRQRIDDWANAIRAEDVERVVSLYAPTVFRSISIRPLRYAGADQHRTERQYDAGVRVASGTALGRIEKRMYIG
jgi:ketosteroid isomerase-like protein